MFTLTHIFTAMRRLTNALNRSAEIFETANSQLEARLSVGPEVDEGLNEVPAIITDSGNNNCSGRSRRLART
jgi:hypothetical protein